VYSKARAKRAGQVLIEVPGKGNLAIQVGNNVVRLSASETSKNACLETSGRRVKLGRGGGDGGGKSGKEGRLRSRVLEELILNEV
jgi:hypothetical protein